MKYRILGKTGIKISEIGFGAWAIGGNWGKQDERDSMKALHKAIELGVNFIDTAAGYGKSEQIIGKILKQYEPKIYIATKIPPTEGTWPPDPYCKIEERFPAKYLRMSVEQRLRNLQVECIDILQLHTWTRAWNKNPVAFEVLQKLRDEGKINYIGISTPEHDQNAVITLMKENWVDVVQVIFNIFEQEPAAELLPVAQENNIGIIVRMVFDEGVLTGKYDENHMFPPDDFRSKYFSGDRLKRAVNRVKKIQKEIESESVTMPVAAIKYALSNSAVSTVITGIRNENQALANIQVSDLSPLSEDLLIRLRRHNWRRAFWYDGK